MTGAKATLVLVETLYAEHRAAALRCVERRFGDPGLAEEATQEAFCQILLALTTGALSGPNVGPAVVLRNALWAAGKIRGRERALFAREQRSAIQGIDDDAAWVRQEARDLVGELCKHLSNSQRQVLHLRYVEGRSDDECAKAMKISVKAFRSRRRRALVEARTASQIEDKRPMRRALSACL